MLRTFLAVELPFEVRDALCQRQEALKRQLPSASWVRPDALHLTVKFLGATPEGDIATIKDSVVQSLRLVKPFVVEIAGLGVFPNHNAPRILWAGMTVGNETFSLIVEKTENTLAPLGFHKEGKPSHPHITLARVKKDQKRFGLALNRTELFSAPALFGSIPVEKLTLFQSELKPTGSVYTVLWTVPLGGDLT